MASISPYPNKKDPDRWRVSYTLTIGTVKKQRSKYEKLKADAELLRARLTELERSSRQGYAPENLIQEWIDRKWITESDVKKAFIHYGALLDQKKAINPNETDYELIFKTAENWSADNSKDGLLGKTHSSRMVYMRRVKNWLEENFAELEDVKALNIVRWTDDLKKEYAPVTIRHTMVAMNQFLDFAVELGMLHKNPARGLSMPKAKRSKIKKILDLEEIDTLLQASLNYWRTDSVMRGALPAVVRVGLYAGLRPSEHCRLEWNCVKFERRVIQVQETRCPISGNVFAPKDYEAREIDAKEALFEFLGREKERQEREGILGTYIVPNRRVKNKAVHPDSLMHAFAKMISRENLAPGITIHSLGHTYITWGLRSGIDLRTMQVRAGHADIKTTEVYLHDIEVDKHPMDKLLY